MNEVLYLDHSGHDYSYEASYHSYLSNKIYNENRLIDAINEKLIMNEAGATMRTKSAKLTAMYEAKLSDKVKGAWNKFITFIKTLYGKFMESMTNILVDEKKYLEKYKDIILGKRPKDIEFSYYGNFEEGIKRIINTEVPVFNYNAHKDALKAEGDSQVVKLIINGFNYDDGSTLADQLKEYFIAGEQGQRSGKFAELNFTDMYNFCYNFEKVKAVTDKDIAHLESSTQAIQNAINSQLNESAIRAYVESVLLEADGDQNNNQQQQTNTTQNTTTNTTTNTANNNNNGNKPNTNTNFSIKTNSYENRDAVDTNSDDVKSQASAANDAGEKKSDIDALVNKWITVCKAIITAKWTATEQISKDYMQIIRAHVRSYVGNDKDKADNARAKTGTNYQKDNENQGDQNNNQQQNTNQNNNK